jgi:hypothetical protein
MFARIGTVDKLQEKTRCPGLKGEFGGEEMIVPAVSWHGIRGSGCGKADVGQESS